MTKIALFGAGGKMGRRLTAALKDREYDMSYIEIGEEGIRVLEELGVSVTKQEDILPDADAVILALPDVLVGRISHEIIPQLRPGSMVMMLDVAAMLAGAIHIRDDISYFFFHPCHHNILKRERKGEHIVCALMQGSDDDYRLGEKVAKDIYTPVIQAHRMSVMQMGLLEPALAETVGIACCSFLRDAVDEVVRQGVPKVAAEEFLLGHLSALSVFFTNSGWLSDGAILTMKRGKQQLFKGDWRKILSPEGVIEQSKAIIAGEITD